MFLTILGRDGAFPTPGGATSGYLLTHKNTAVALDLGSGCLARLTALTAPEQLTALVLSHWHFDHCGDVLPLLYRLQRCKGQGCGPLHVYGPVDENSPIRQILLDDAAIILHDVAPGDTIALDEVTFTVYAARHPVPAVMYRVTDGSRTLCYTGDTNTIDGLADFAQDADLLLADGMFLQDRWAEHLPHLSSPLAAKLSVEAQAKRLLLTHLDPFCDPSELLKEARAIRLDTQLAEPGKRYEI